MLFQRRTPPVVVAPAPYTVPDANQLRQHALQAGWQRDRQVARRRLALRWLWWALPRYGLPTAALAALLLALYTLIQWAITPKPPAVPPSVSSPAALAPATAAASVAAPPSAPELGLPLRAEPVLPASQSASQPPSSPADPVAKLPLKPDNSLHLKEP